MAPETGAPSRVSTRPEILKSPGGNSGTAASSFGEAPLADTGCGESVTLSVSVPCPAAGCSSVFEAPELLVTGAGDGLSSGDRIAAGAVELWGVPFGTASGRTL